MVCVGGVMIGLVLMAIIGIVTAIRRSGFHEKRQRYWESLRPPPTSPLSQANRPRDEAHAQGIALEPAPPPPAPVSLRLPGVCPRCEGAMVRGFIPEFVGQYASVGGSCWVEGTLGAHRMERSIPISAFRCSSCGYLELYARPPGWRE
jgi:hypothetical protein